MILTTSPIGNKLLRETKKFSPNNDLAISKNSSNNLVGWIIKGVIILLAVTIISGILSSSSKKEASLSDDTSSWKDKYAYNSTNGIFLGKIIDKKVCSVNSNTKCYVIYMGPKYIKTDEYPQGNVDIKLYMPASKPSWYTYNDWGTWK